MDGFEVALGLTKIKEANDNDVPTMRDLKALLYAIGIINHTLLELRDARVTSFSDIIEVDDSAN